MRVRETELPGIGARFGVQFDDDGVFTLLIENDGTRHAYWRRDADADSEKLFEVSESEARKIAAIFDGTYFTPVGEDVEEIFEHARIKWIHLADDSPLVGRTIGEAGIRSTTGVTVIAIERDETTMANPTRDTRLEADDVIVAVGTDEEHATFSETLL